MARIMWACWDGGGNLTPSLGIGQPAARHACPSLGEQTDEVLASLGYRWDDIVELKVKGAIL